MDLSNIAGIALQQDQQERYQEKKEEMAMEFERVFARHLVEEMTKGSFKMSDNVYGAQSFSINRTHITDTLATELAEQRKLGMADMVLKHWNK